MLTKQQLSLTKEYQKASLTCWLEPFFCSVEIRVLLSKCECKIRPHLDSCIGYLSIPTLWVLGLCYFCFSFNRPTFLKLIHVGFSPRESLIVIATGGCWLDDWPLKSSTALIPTDLLNKVKKERKIHSDSRKWMWVPVSSSSSSSSTFIVRLLQIGHRCITQSPTQYRPKSNLKPGSQRTLKAVETELIWSSCHPVTSFMLSLILLNFDRCTKL